MRRLSAWTCATLILALLVSSAPAPLSALPQQSPPQRLKPSISQADAKADIETLLRAIENVHPDPYNSISKEMLEAERQRITANLPDAVTRQELWRRISPLVASLADGHSRLDYPFEGLFYEQVFAFTAKNRTETNDQDELLRRAKTFRVETFPPRIVGLDDEGHLIVTATDGDGTDLRRGDRILSINNQPAEALIADWSRKTSGDSYSHRAVQIADDLHNLLLMHSMLPPYSVVVADADGRERAVMVAGRPQQGTTQPRRTEPGSESFSYQTLESGVGYMNFNSMLADDEGAFKAALAAMFRRAAAESVRTLIVDLRRNEGGSEDFGNELLRYITVKPYRSWGRREVKRSAEFRAFAKSEYFPAAVRWLPLQYLVADGRKVWTGPVGTFATWSEPPLKTPKRAEPFFSGPVCVLTGPRTFSAAVILADTIKTHLLATIVGEETGGHPNMYAAPYVFALPKSMLPAQISAVHHVRANGDASDRHGVIPDIVVKTTAADIRDGRDPVIERARSCPPVR